MEKQARASKKQQELLQFIDGFITGHGYGPSYREVMRALGYKSVSTVAIHIDQLIAKGYLEKKDNSARSLQVLTLRPGAGQSGDDEAVKQIKKKINEFETTGNTKAVATLTEALKLIQSNP